jgi:leukotriene-A4 hydrolase
MMRATRIAAVAALLSACSHQPPQAPPAAPEPPDLRRDYHSCANTRDFGTRHMVLDLQVDFARKVLTGSVELHLQRRTADAIRLVLDTRDLDIASVEAAAGQGPWQAVAWSLGERDAILGSALTVAVPVAADRVRIAYSTRPEASGLQWVTPEQTAGKKHPFLYTQSQAIHARSWIPSQDTPQVRSTYEARIRTPKPLVAVMSALNRPDARRDGDYRVVMKQPVPSYLIALAVGDLEFRPIGRRTGVWGERAMVRGAAYEFEDTEEMMRACEKLFGPYRWDRYDMLVLPPSFPYGGMENPRLTFLTPTAVIGDKSGVSLIAHELAHSWSGNLVTNATWRDFWLNEGTTTYLTYRIMDEVFGQRRGDMERVLGQRSLADDLALAGNEAHKALAYDVRGLDPDEVFSTIPYQRGQLFLTWLESRFGRPKFDAFLRGWFDDNAFASRTTEDFIAYLEDKLLAPNPGVVSRAAVDAWIYGPALPADAVYARSDVFAKVDEQRAAWLDGRLPTAKLAAANWSSHEWQHFLDNLPQDIAAARLAELDARFKLTQEPNSYIVTSWYRVAIRAGHAPALPAVERFLLAVGRRKFLNPLYRELAKTDEGRAVARRVFDQARARYHPIAQASIERILRESEKKPAPPPAG